jgi:iron complex transport system substrate-binding protein
MHLATRTLARAATAAVLVVSVGACGGDGPDDAGGGDAGGGAFPMAVDDCGREVVLDEPPRRVLTIGASAVNLLHAAGASDQIAVRSGEFGTPPSGEVAEAVADVPVLTDEDPGREAILGAGVDLVVGYGLLETTAEDLEAAGVESIVPSGFCGSHDGGQPPADDLLPVVADDVEQMGNIFSTADTADANAEALRERLEAVEPAASGTAAAIYFFGGDTDRSAYGGTSLVNDMLERVGLTNVFAETDQAYLPLDMEALFDADPDILVIVWAPDQTYETIRDRFLAIPGFADLSAVANDRMVDLPAAVAEPDPGAIDGLEHLTTELARLPTR